MTPVGNPQSAIANDNPWPGLAPFTEAQSAQFFGRDAEIKTLARRVQGDPLTVLFGQSGLGKSSLLQAGVFPRLRSADFCPVYIRLDHSPGAPALSEQVKTIVAAETTRHGAWSRPEAARPGESLWEFFHHRDHRLVSPGGIALSPVLVFDQFEELFTLGGAARSAGSGSPGSGAERQRAVAFMAELAELVENRPPEALVARVEQSPAELDALDFGATDYRVVITLREDFLPHLESLKTIMPALMDNRLRLSRMNGVQALEAVLKPAAGLVTEEVARAIVEFVAGARGGSTERLAELDVEPPLLSVICRELNERRRTLGQAQITADLVTGNRREILTDFYERSVTDLPAAMRAFVEDHLLTKSGFRDNLSLEAALEFPGVTRPLIATLVDRRLLRLEDRLGVERVELAHDVLAEVIRASRDARRTREAQIAAERELTAARDREAAARRALWRMRAIAVTCATLLLLAVASTLFGWWNLRRARDAEQAQGRLRQQAEANERKAQTEATRSGLVAQFMKEMLKGVGPRVALGRDTRLLRDILDTTVARLGTDLVAEPAVAAEMRETLGEVYAELGDYNRAAAILHEALAQRRGLQGSEPPAVVAVLTRLGRTLARVGSLAEAEARLREALALARKTADHSDTEVMTALATVLATQGQSTEALAMYREVLVLEKSRWGAEHLRTVAAIEELGFELGSQHQWAEAEASLHQAVMLRRKLEGNESEKLAKVLNTLGNFLLSEAKYAAAEKAQREALAIHRKRLGAEHPDLPPHLDALARAVEAQGNLVEAEQLFRESATMRRKYLGDDHPDLAVSLRNVSRCLQRRGETAKAEAMLSEAVGIFRRLGLDRDLALTLGVLASIQPPTKLDEAEKLYREKLEIERRIYGSDPTRIIATLDTLRQLLWRGKKAIESANIEREILELRTKLPRSPASAQLRTTSSRGFFLQQQRKFAEAEIAYREDLAHLRQEEGNESVAVACVLEYLGRLLMWSMYRLPEAEATIREALAIRRKVTTNTDLEGNMGTTLNNLGHVLFHQCKLAEAEAAQSESVAMLKLMPASVTPVTLEQLAYTLRLQGKHAAIEALWRDAVDFARERHGAESKETADNLGLLAAVLLETRQFSEAEASARQSLDLRTKLAPDDWRVGEARSILGRAVAAQGRHAAAETEFTAAFAALTERKPKIESGDYQACLRATAERLAEIYQSTGQPAKAAEWLERAADVDKQEEASAAKDSELAVLLKQAGELRQQGKLAELETVQRRIVTRLNPRGMGGSKLTSAHLLPLADTLARQGKLNEAELLVRRSLEQRERFYRAGSWQVVDSRSALGGVLLQQRRYDEAEPLLLASLTEMKKIEAGAGLDDDQKGSFKARIASLVELYEATDRSEKAAEWKKTLADLSAEATAAPKPRE